MKRLFALALIGCSLQSSMICMASETEEYTLSSPEIFGDYEQLTTNDCADEKGRPCVGARVKKVNGKTTIELDDYNLRITLHLSKKGRVSFKWENPDADECDSPDCWNLLSISGTIFPKNKSHLPQLRVLIKKNYPHPENDESPQGNVTEIQNYNKRT